MSEPPEHPPGRTAAQASADGHKPLLTVGNPVLTVPLIVAGACLAIPFVAMLWVDSYARLTPALIGIPFFYWYQMLWVLVSTLLTVVAYVIVRRREETVRRERHAGGEEG
ncbi:hypothetical protein GCM10010214_25850 [Streptomyces abikoensis]|nr:hypothetical protein GCM10010214_25850 [Streptomyces abikoensis]